MFELNSNKNIFKFEFIFIVIIILKDLRINSGEGFTMRNFVVLSLCSK
jgi:hypothetical protein